MASLNNWAYLRAIFGKLMLTLMLSSTRSPEISNSLISMGKENLAHLLCQRRDLTGGGAIREFFLRNTLYNQGLESINALASWRHTALS